MATMVKLKCPECGKKFSRNIGEVRRIRHRGRNAYCGHLCAGLAVNRRRRKTPVVITKVCPICSGPVITVEGRHEATFCSPRCASTGSVTPARRAAARLAGRENSKKNFILGPVLGMRQREAWKNRRIGDFLDGRLVAHVFEYRVGEYIFDLALPKQKLLVEFDSPYHRYESQKRKDRKKDKRAKRAGWRVHRIEVPLGIIDPKCLQAIFRR